MNELTNPVGVFDGGIGSFGIVETIQKYYPQQDVIWLADRASFPLGQKSADELFERGRNSIQFLKERGAKTVVVAANVLTMVVFDRLQNVFPDLKLYGITPPVENAATHGDFCVFGVKAMVNDPQLRAFIDARKPPHINGSVANASPLIDELVETGLFKSDPDYTLSVVKKFMDALPQACRHAKAYTLSSTHLPWLKPAFQQACSDKIFLDPADDLVAAMPLNNDGSGRIVALTTENPARDLTSAGLTNILDLMGYQIAPEVVTIP